MLVQHLLSDGIAIYNASKVVTAIRYAVGHSTREPDLCGSLADPSSAFTATELATSLYKH